MLSFCWQLRPRFVLAASTLALFTSACGFRVAPHAAEPPPVPLHLDPACDLAPAAGLSWLVALRPRAMAEIADLIPAIALVIPEERFAAFANAHGGIDLRQIHDLCIARYERSLLTIARVPIDSAKVASAFEDRAPGSVTRTRRAPNPYVLRLSTETAPPSQRVQLLLFGQQGIAIEEGSADMLRAAEAFAFGKLKKASPALKGAALLHAAEVLGDDAPVRVFAAGPFKGETASGIGGLLRSATAVGASAAWAGSSTHLRVRVVLIGAWERNASEAKARFDAAAHVLSASAIGHLFGLDRPVHGAAVRMESDALVLDATIDGSALARGLHDAVDAEVAEMMRTR